MESQASIGERAWEGVFVPPPFLVWPLRNLIKGGGGGSFSRCKIQGVVVLIKHRTYRDDPLLQDFRVRIRACKVHESCIHPC